MHLFALFLSIWLLPKGDTLKCYECIPDTSGMCTETQKECPSPSHQCGASRVTSYAGGLKIRDYKMKACTLPQECGEASMNFEFSKTLVNTKCCNSNLCNTHYAPEPSKTPPNGKRCFSCDGSTCDNILPCEGNEDHCINAITSAAGNTITLKGCVSELMCSASNMTNFGTSQLKGTKFSCCKGDLCNSAVTASAGLQLLVALVSLTLFS